jgi:hypothetical protein
VQCGDIYAMVEDMDNRERIGKNKKAETRGTYPIN